MCGIVGFVNLVPNAVNLNQEKFLTDAIYMDTLRGWDSTGLVLVKGNGILQKYKKAVSGCEFIQLRKYNKMIKDLQNVRFAFAHNRAATVGSVRDETAHPFTFGDITMIHNGTLDFDNGLNVQALEVDSAEIAYALSQTPAVKVLEKLRGAFALVWYDASDKTINLARNSERPLILATNQEDTAMYFASERWMIEAAQERHKGLGTLTYAALPVGQLIKVKLDAKTFDESENIKFTPYVKKQEGYLGYGGGYGGSYGNTYHTYGGCIPPEDDVLDKLDLNPKDIVLFEKRIFNPYKGNTSCGNIVGQLRSNCKKEVNDIQITVYNEKLSSWDEKERVYGGEVMRGYANTQNKQPVVVIDNIFPLGSVEEFKNGAYDEYDQYYVNQRIDDIDANFEEVYGNETFEDSRGNLIPADEFSKLIKDGCAWCNGDLEIGDDITWSGDSPVCEECVDIVANYGIIVGEKDAKIN